MNKCQTSCIYYHVIQDKNKKPSIKIACDYREGEEIKKIPEEEKSNCKHYKTLKEIILNRLTNY